MKRSLMFTFIVPALLLSICQPAKAVDYTITWTAPYDCRESSCPESTSVAGYEIRYCYIGASNFNWDTADKVVIPDMVPKAPGETETYQLDNLPVETPITVCIRSKDGFGNWSDDSNLRELYFTDDVKPVAITDLR